MQLYHKLLITVSMVSLAVLVIGAAGLFIVDKVGDGTRAVLEGEVAIADASIEIVSSVERTASLLREHMLTDDTDRLDQIEKEMENYHKIDDVWMLAIMHGTGSQEFIESEAYQLWLERGYGASGVVIRKADPEVISIIEELRATHEKFHETAHRLMDLHREEIRTEQNRLDTYSKAKEYRHSIRDTVIAQGDYLLLGDMWRAEYEGKEAMFQYRDKKHMREWIEAIETLHIDIANSTLTPGIKSEMQNHSAEYLRLVKTMSGHALRLSEINAEMQTQMEIINGHAMDMGANVAEIRATALSARVDAKRKIEEYTAYMLTLLTAVMVVVIVLIMSVGYLTNKFISQPIVALRDATRKTGEGDLDVRIKVDRGDEIGELGTAFNEMAEALEKRTTNLAEHAEKLERTNRFRETFTDILRHDLLNPIGVIGNIVEILEDDKNLRDSSEFLVIKRNVKKLKEIIYTASDYAKLESTEKLERTELDLAKVIESIIEDFGPYIKDKGMNVEFKPEGGYKASASPIIESVFVNLLSNAIKYSPKDTEIKIAIEDIGKSWKISFADRGEGVSDEYKETIFDRFTRKDKKGVKGTGFGLAIVERIVEMHGGRVWVEDNPEGGSVFYVEIPK